MVTVMAGEPAEVLSVWPGFPEDDRLQPVATSSSSIPISGARGAGAGGVRGAWRGGGRENRATAGRRCQPHEGSQYGRL